MSEKKRDSEIEIIVPPLGEAVVEAQISRWLVRAGDDVKPDQRIVGLALDKVDVELEAPAGGVVEMLVAEGDIVKVGDVIGHIHSGPLRRASVTRHAELLAAVAASNTEAAHRAYANFLLEADGVLPPWGVVTVRKRGEYLDAVARLRTPTPEDDVRALTQFRNSLVEIGRTTAESLLRIPGTLRVVDGFVVGLATSLAMFVEWQPLIRARAPLRELALSRLVEEPAERLASVARLEQLRVLTLTGAPTEPVHFGVIVRLLESPVFSAIEQVEIRCKLFDVSSGYVTATLRELTTARIVLG